MKQSAERPRALVVEDNALVALELVDILERDGCKVVGSPATLSAALALARKAEIDFALLDFNLGSETAEPVAQVLARRSIPFALVTAYPGCVLPEQVRGRPRVQKPFTVRDIRELAAQLSSPSGGKARHGARRPQDHAG